MATEGVRESAIRNFLIDEGLPDLDADTFLREAQKNVRSENRSHGCLRLMAGGTMLISGVLVVFSLYATLAGLVPVKLGGSATIAFIVVGPTLVLTGILAILSGIFTTATGK